MLCHVFDKDLNPIVGANIMVNDSEKIYISDKNGETNLSFEDSRPKKIIAFKDGLELASWSLRKGKIEIVMRKSRYKLLFGKVNLLGGKAAGGLEIIFLGEKYSENAITDADGNFDMRLPVEANISENSRFLVDNHQVIQQFYEYRGSFNFNIILKKDPISVIEGKIITGTIRDSLNNRIPSFSVNIGKFNYATDRNGAFNAIVPANSEEIRFDDYRVKRIDSLENDRFNIILDTYYNPKDSTSPWYEPPPQIIYKEKLITQNLDSVQSIEKVDSIFNISTYFDTIDVRNSEQLNKTLQNILAKLRISQNLSSNEKDNLKKQLELIEYVIKNGEFEGNDENLEEAKSIIDKLRVNISQQEEKIAQIEEEKKAEAEKFRQRLFIFSGIIATLALLSVIFFIFTRKLKKQKNELKRIGGQLELKVEEVKNQNAKITDSIRYAQTIQQAILPEENIMKQKLSDMFILYRPKDIVSGDFYWFATAYDQKSEKAYTYLAAIDCTGHGVPGAFMSLIGYTILNQIISKGNSYDTDSILEALNTGITSILKQDQQMNDDGMDVCLCRFEYMDDDNISVLFTGAKRPLYIVGQKTGNIRYLKGDNKSIGGFQKKNRRFTNQSVYLQKGDLLYLSTDGMVDQNNPENKKFGKRRFGELLTEIYKETTVKQKQLIENELDEHQKNVEQRDDITIIGVKL